MSVKRADLDNPERGLRLADRAVEAAVAEEKSRQEETPTKRRPDPELGAIRERILAAKIILPQGAELHCRDCWTRGRDAALRIVEGKPT